MKTLANKITIFRVILVPVFLTFAYLDLNWFAFTVFVVASVSDAFDGYVARKFNQISNFGKFLDPLADKMIVVSALCYFVDAGSIHGWVLAAIIFREFAVSAFRLMAVEHGNVIAARLSGKIKTAITMVCISAMLVFPQVVVLADISQYLILAVTLLSGIDVFASNISVFKF